MPIVFDNLKPYKSYVLSEFREDDPDFDSFDTGIIEEVKHVINSAQPRHGEISIQQSEPLTSFGDLRIGFVHYLETRMANWADGVDVKDMIQQIVVVARRGNIVVFCASDNAMAGRLLRSPSNQYPILSLLRGISSGRLNLAFATGQARTLWLSGTHRRIPVKADNKVLSGMDLRFALDPLDDQTFIFTSARCVPETELQGIHQVGITPRKSRAWIGPTYEWDEFVQVTDTFLAHLNAATGSTDDPFPVLSAPLNDASPLDTAYDVALIPLELIADITQLSDEERQEIERWTVQACYEVGDVSGPDFNLDVNLGSQQIGTLTFKLDQTVLPFARYEITTKSVGSGDEAE